MRLSSTRAGTAPHRVCRASSSSQSVSTPPRALSAKRVTEASPGSRKNNWSSRCVPRSMRTPPPPPARDEHAQRRELPGVLAALFDVHPERPAEHLAVEHAAQQARHRQQAAIQPDREHDARLVGRMDHRLGVGRADGHRLFDEDMKPRPTIASVAGA